MQNWEAAMEDLTRLRETIDNNVCIAKATVDKTRLVSAVVRIAQFHTMTLTYC